MTKNIVKLLGDFKIMEAIDVKPNYSELGKKYDLDPRTVKKYYEGFKGKSKTRDKPSKLKKYHEEIKTKLLIPRTSIKGVYKFMVNKYGIDDIGSYSNFKYYVKKNELSAKKRSDGNPRYECKPGEMAQVDWKENITLYNRKNEKFNFNIFHIVLKYSRYSYVEYSVNKTTEDVFRCLLNSFKFFGGKPEVLLIDNMKSLVSIDGKNKHIINKAEGFAKDVGVSIRTCKVRTPETKGTNESRNKMLDWVRLYNHEFDTEEDIIQIIKKINDDMNLETCQGTGVKPIIAFTKEKEYLAAYVEDFKITDAYLSRNKVKVSNDSLIYYKGSRYSVDKILIGKTVEVHEFSNKIYIYYNGKIQTIHELSSNPINYKDNHYKSLMANKVKEEELEKTVKNNLANFDQLLEIKKYKVSKEDALKSFNHMCAYILSNIECSVGYCNYYLSSLDETNKQLFLEEMKKIFPYIQSEKEFLNHFKYFTKNSKVTDICFNVLCEQSLSPVDILTDEGFKILSEEYQDKLTEYYEAMAGENK